MFRTRVFSTSAIIVLMAVLMLSCSDGVGDNTIMGSPDDPGDQRVPAQGQEVLFEVSYVNFAWGYKLGGFYIDKRGDVFRFSRDNSDERWRPDDWAHISEQDLRDKYSVGKNRIGTIDLVTLTSMVDLIGEASLGEMTERIGRCNDFGGKSWVAYVQDAQTGDYEGINLYSAGDWAQRNKSLAAETLFEWLRDVAGESGEIACGCPE